MILNKYHWLSARKQFYGAIPIFPPCMRQVVWTIYAVLSIMGPRWLSIEDCRPDGLIQHHRQIFRPNIVVFRAKIGRQCNATLLPAVVGLMNRSFCPKKRHY